MIYLFIVWGDSMKKKNNYVNCEVCNKVFHINPARLKKNNHHTCSRKCMGKLFSKIHSKKIIKKCEVCGKEVFYKKSKIKE